MNDATSVDADDKGDPPIIASSVSDSADNGDPTKLEPSGGISPRPRFPSHGAATADQTSKIAFQRVPKAKEF